MLLSNGQIWGMTSKTFDIPGALAEVRSLARGLEEEPLRGQELFGRMREAELALLVVCLNKILDNGS